MAAKSDDRRDAILTILADHVLSVGLGGASLRPLADAAGTSDRMLLYYFRDKAEIMEATLERIAARLTADLSARISAPAPFDEVRARLIAIVLSDEVWPFMRLWLEIAARAGQGDAFYRAVGERLGRGFHMWAAAQLAPASPKTAEAEAARLFTLIEGAALLKAVGLEDIARQGA